MGVVGGDRGEDGEEAREEVTRGGREEREEAGAKVRNGEVVI